MSPLSGTSCAKRGYPCDPPTTPAPYGLLRGTLEHRHGIRCCAAAVTGEHGRRLQSVATLADSWATPGCTTPRGCSCPAKRAYRFDCHGPLTVMAPASPPPAPQAPLSLEGRVRLRGEKGGGTHKSCPGPRNGSRSARVRTAHPLDAVAARKRVRRHEPHTGARRSVTRIVHGRLAGRHSPHFASARPAGPSATRGLRALGTSTPRRAPGRQRATAGGRLPLPRRAQLRDLRSAGRVRVCLGRLTHRRGWVAGAQSRPSVAQPLGVNSSVVRGQSRAPQWLRQASCACMEGQRG